MGNRVKSTTERIGKRYCHNDTEVKKKNKRVGERGRESLDEPKKIIDGHNR